LFQKFLRSYILEHAQTSIITDDLRAFWANFIEDNFNATDTNRILSSVDWDTWIYQPGLPPVYLDFTTRESNFSSSLADQYVSFGGRESPEDYQNFTNDFYSNLKVVFLERLSLNPDVNLAVLLKIDEDYNLTLTRDPECKQRWFPIGIRHGYEPVMEQAHKFISSQGRLKYLNPIYLALLQTNQRDTAI